MSEKIPNARGSGSYGLQGGERITLKCWWCGEPIPRGATYIRQNVGEKDLLFHPGCEQEMRHR